MKAFLMYKQLNFDVKAVPPANAADLVQDLELETLVEAMANDDTYLANVGRSALLQASITDQETVLYRQAVLNDCLRNAVVVKAIYAIAVDSLGAEKKNSWAYLSNYPSGILRRSLEVLDVLVELLARLRRIADRHAGEFRSEGFVGLFATLRREMDDGYFERVHDHLRELKFSNGVLVGARLGKGFKARDFVLLRSNEPRLSWIERLFAPKRPGYTFSLHPRDDAGAHALSELRDRGIDQVADAVARSTDHIVSFFMMLRNELAFYMGCLNLNDHLREKGAQVCLPNPVPSSDRTYTYDGLYDPCLALRMGTLPVSNDGDLRAAYLVMITGANQGGKSTFLRSIGVAQLMMQSGMFVAARAFLAPLSEGVFTHYKREEDAEMRSGKFDEELVRVSNLLADIHPDALILFNESFAATNEREGSEIATQIIRGLLARRVRIVFVTHMFELARAFFDPRADHSTFLRAEREADGRRSFKLVQGEPLQTSYGRDLYERAFGDTAGACPTESSALEETSS
ncbi:MAG TPA: DNA mismatch repair protein MutS [Bradyrhizobium sp.]|nr:DNA mismatch repair protein MutS [Bradyrhizobium sp.]